MHIQKRMLSIFLAFLCLLAGCGKQDSFESDDSTDSSVSDSASDSTSKDDAASDSNAESSDEDASDSDDDETSSDSSNHINGFYEEESSVEDTNPDNEMVTYTGTDYLCEIDIPADWVPSTGASDGVITDNEVMFESADSSGDTISLIVQEAADTDEEFAAITADTEQAALEEYLTSVTITEWKDLTINGCAAFRVRVVGEMDDTPISIEQLVVNCTDETYGDRQYSFSYLNVSGAEVPYDGNIDSYFRLIAPTSDDE